jgi:hypothetical protein
LRRLHLCSGSPGVNAAIYGLTLYAPDDTYAPGDFMNLRFGAEVNGFDINLFANAFASKGGSLTGGRGQCAPPSVAAATV